MKTEIQLQAECFQWHWNTFAAHRGLLCYNLNNSANKIQGMQNKAIGLIKGRSDMVLYHESKAYMIEFKTERGIQSKDQLDWEMSVIQAGFQYHIIRSFEQFKELIYKIYGNQ